MGFDYYIAKVLHIYYSDDNYLTIELEREKCDYNYQYDEDADDYEDRFREYVNRILTPQMNPIYIYTNQGFNKVPLETRYKPLINIELSKHGKQWCEITKIIKTEERYKR